MHRYQWKGESLQEFTFEFHELIQAATNSKPKDTKGPLKGTSMHKNHLIWQLAPKLLGMHNQVCKKL